MCFSLRGAQALEELFLGFAVHDEVGAGDQQLGRHLDRLGIGDHALGGIVSPSSMFTEIGRVISGSFSNERCARDRG